MNETGRIQAIERAIFILNQFSSNTTSLKFVDIVKRTNLNKSTVFNIIDTLKYFGLLSQDDETKKYMLGVKLIELGEIARESINILKIARRYMISIRDEINETVQLAKLENGNTVYLDKVESSHHLHTYTQRGTIIPAYATGLGKVMLAYADLEYIHKYFGENLNTFTKNTISTRKELEYELNKIKKDGIAFDNEEYAYGLVCYSAPIFSFDGKVKYAISVSMPIIRVNENFKKHIIDLIKEKALKISMEIGYKKENKK